MHCIALGQTLVPLVDNLSLAPNTHVKIAAGVYNLADTGEDGLIIVNNVSQVIIDGDSVEVNGMNSAGYLIRVEHADQVIIRNFTLAAHFRYAVFISNSSNIEITACNFSMNRGDSAGLIPLYDDIGSAHGGGVLCFNSDNILLQGNILKQQNDGAAFYHCRKVDAGFNDCSNNLAFGLRLHFTDSSFIHHNNCTHTRRPLTDQANSAGLGMIVSNNNLVAFNDLRYSESGISIGQFQHSNLPNRNTVQHNDCSACRRYGITASFAGWNVFRLNQCSRNLCGIKLDYSFHSSLDSNLVLHCQQSGISIDRGYANRLSGNFIIGNPCGIKLMEGIPVAGYQNQDSREYQIDSNYLEVNTLAISTEHTEQVLIRGNHFLKNSLAVQIKGANAGDSLTANYFDKSLLYDIDNDSPDPLHAIGNIFEINDIDYISAKILDQLDDPARGLVHWNPFSGNLLPVYELAPPEELSEPPAYWATYPEACPWSGLAVPMYIGWDTLEKVMGNASVFLQTGTGWYNTCTFRDTGQLIPRWELSNYTHLSFWIKSDNTNLGGFQHFYLHLGNHSGGYFRYTATGLALSQSIGQWTQYLVPLHGSAAWPRESFGSVALTDINYVELYTDTYGMGYSLWLDGMAFLLSSARAEPRAAAASFRAFPNPAGEQLCLQLDLPGEQSAWLEIFDAGGRRISSRELLPLKEGGNTWQRDVSSWPRGLYLLQVVAGSGRAAYNTRVVKY